MSSRRRTERTLIASAWSEEELDAEDSLSNTQVIAKRAPRDSYSYERPLLFVPFELPEALLEDLEDGATFEAELRYLQSCPTVRPTGN